jgi:circadian clock protein KaiB
MKYGSSKSQIKALNYFQFSLRKDLNPEGKLKNMKISPLHNKLQVKNQERGKIRSENKEIYILSLFITGMTSNSLNAVGNIKAICEKYLKNRYELEVIDIYQQPDLALTEDLIAIPVLIKRFPLPESRMIGDLSSIEEVLIGLNLNN